MASTAQSDKFAAFDILTTAYKVIDDRPVEVDIMIPKGLKPEKYPVILRFHGGFFVTGSRRFPDWFASWTLGYAVQQQAIVVNADYRLLPEATGAELYQDLLDVYQWVHSDLATYLSTNAPGILPDTSRIITCGESAGGYAAIQLGLAYPDEIRGIIGIYPMSDWKDEYYARPPEEKSLFGMPVVPSSVVDDHIAALGPKAVATSFFPPERLPLGLAMAYHNRFKEFFGDSPILNPIDRLDPSRVSKVPPLLILHGREDSAVPANQSVAFVEKVKKLYPGSKVHLVIQPGEHGFDAEATLETAWLKEGLEFITTEWVGP